MRYPEPLKKNGTIGLVAPSYGCATEPYITRLEAALREAARLGFSVTEAPHVRLDEAFGRSGPADVLGEELNRAYLSPDNGALISVGGGELMCEVVPYIDFEAIAAARPKWYMGFSDNTNFTFLSATLADTAAIYGPCFPALGITPWHKSITDAVGLLTGEISSVKSYPSWELFDTEGEDPLAPYNLTEKTEYRYFNTGWREARLEGRLIGGCGDILFTLLGTRFDRVREFNEKYAKDGIIWFLEFCDLHPMDVRRALWAMREAGWFSKAKGFLIGRPLHFGEEQLGLNMYEAVYGAIGSLGVPMIEDVDIGHLPPMLPIISGAKAEIRAEENELEIKYLFR